MSDDEGVMSDSYGLIQVVVPPVIQEPLRQLLASRGLDLLVTATRRWRAMGGGMTEISGEASQVRAFARAEDGTETDITEGVQALYDLVISSMDWGSGFWTAEDALPVATLARLMGFKQAEEAERYVRHQQHNREQQEFLARRQDAKAHRPLPEHDHVFSSAGKCMWFYCEALDVGAVDWIGR